MKNVQKNRAFLILRNISIYRQGYIFLIKLKYIRYEDKNNKIEINKYSFLRKRYRIIIISLIFINNKSTSGVNLIGDFLTING
jgi:hypothetical protein